MTTALPTYVPPPGLRTPLDEFRDLINRKYNLKLETYPQLHAFSVTRLNDFWLTVWEFTGVKASVHPFESMIQCVRLIRGRDMLRLRHQAIDDDAAIDQFPAFFQGARLNFAENMMAGKDDNDLAVIEMNETNMSQPKEYSWRDLRNLVRRYADALLSTGLRKGQVVAVVGSNCIRSLALLLSTAAVGGIFASFATDMGAKALNGRLQLLKPRLLFAESTYYYNGKHHDISNVLDAAVKELQDTGTIEAIIIDPRQKLKLAKSVLFDDFLARDCGKPLKFEQVPFETPLVVMFSSGTTGLPKGVVHSHGGLVVNGRKENLLHNNLGPGDLTYQYTNIGWTLWNISIHALFVGASVILYNGSPFYPTPERFLRSLFKYKITSFGAGPRYYAELQKLKIQPRKFAQTLHTIISTGAVLTPPLAKWLAEAFGPICQLSMSGGTELCGSFIHGTRSMPSYPGELAVKALGMDVAVFSADGNELPDGESGELVCRKPFPNMPAMFWNDPGRKRYSSSYFNGFPHVWTHGDFIRVNPETKGLYVLGRSDGVLNPSGVRFGSSEIYSIMSTSRFSNLIVDSIVVGQQRITGPYSDAAEQVVLFVKCAPEVSTTTLRVRPDLEAAIREQIAQDLSRRHVPTFVFETEVVPYNANGKKLEIQVRAVLCGGEAALSKLKLTQDELMQIKWYEPFYRIEKVLEGLSREGGAKARL